MVKIPGYTHMGNYRKEKKGGGVSILVQEGIPYVRRSDLDIFDEGKIESIFIEVLSKNGKKIIVGSMYRPPNTDIHQFSTNITKIITTVRSHNAKTRPEIIIGMDHNIDLLKSKDHHGTQTFIDDLSDMNI